MSANAASTSPASPIAIARFSSTTGEPVSRASSRYNPAIWDQSWDSSVAAIAA
jgi:hypothetical protein